MPHKIPDEETISSAIKAVMKRTPQIETQTEFLRLVRKELSKVDEEYRVSGERIRRIGLEKGLVKISIEYRSTDIEDLPHTCPVCRNAMTSQMNRTLEGDFVEIKRKCTVCPYIIGRDVHVPGRYVFSRAGKGDLSPQEASLRKLRKAGAKIREAADFIKEAVDGTDFEERGNELISSLKEMIDSKESSVSIKNISLDIKHSGEDPDWVRPTASVKNSNRKDI